MTRTLSYSEVSLALTCEAQWDFAYGGHLTGGTVLKRREVAAPLSNGRAWGRAMAAWHAFEPTLISPIPAKIAAHEALLTSYAEDAREQAAAGMWVPLDTQVERANWLGAVLDHYTSSCEPLSNLTRIEEEFWVALPSRSGRQRSTRYRFHGFIDGWTVDSSGQWIVEFKLRKRLTSPEQVQLSRQIRWYAWVLQRMIGMPIIGAILDERLAEVPKAPRLVKAGKESPLQYECSFCSANPEQPCEGKRGPLKTFHKERRELCAPTYRPSHEKDQLCTSEAYLELCAEYGVEPDFETAAALRNRVWQQRHPIQFRAGELEEAGEELVSAAQLIRDLDSGTRYPIRNAQPRLCQSCRYLPACPAPHDELYLDTLYERDVPKRDRVESRAGGKAPARDRLAPSPRAHNGGPATVGPFSYATAVREELDQSEIDRAA